MNAKTLTNLYTELTPEERYPLIVSALLREDEVESDRLRDSAPMIRHRICDYHGHLEGFHYCFLTHVIDCLDLATWMMRCDLNSMLLLLAEEPSESSDDWHSPAQQLFALLLVNRCEAWRQFCAAKGIDGEAFLRLIPASKTIEHAEAIAKETAFTVEEADAWLTAKRGEDSQARRVESYLDEFATICRMFLEHWT